MTIKHPYNLEIKYTVSEDVNTEQKEYIEMKIFEYKPELEAQGLEPEANFKKHYLKLTFIRMMFDEGNMDPVDLADSESQELTNAVIPLMGKTGEKLASALDIYPEGFSKLIYLDSARIYGDFSESSLPAAISKAFKILAKGTPEQEWVAIAYQENTFLNKSKLVNASKVESLVEQTGLLQLSEKASGMAKDENTWLMASGYTLNMDYELDSNLINQNKIVSKVKP